MPRYHIKNKENGKKQKIKKIINETRNQSHAHRHTKRKKRTQTLSHIVANRTFFLSMVYRLFVVLLCLRLLIFLFLLHLFSRSIFSLSFYSSFSSSFSSSISSSSSSFSHFSVFILCKIYIYILSKKSLPFLRKSNIYIFVCVE